MDTIGGYRIVRRLGAGERAEVFLGHSDSAGPQRGSTVAVKLFRPGVDQSGIDREVEVLSRGRSRHLLRLDDVATTDDGRHCLVFTRLASGSLARLLAERGTLARGEVVTILAPLAAAISELHDARCCHGGIVPGAVFFDGDGAPVLARFGHASTFGDAARGEHRPSVATVAERTAEPGVAEDLRSLRSLAGALLAHTSSSASGGREGELLEWLEAPERETETAGFARELGVRLFDLAEAMPVLPRPYESGGSASRTREDAVVLRARAAPPAGARMAEGGAPGDGPVSGSTPRRFIAGARALRGAAIGRGVAAMSGVRRPFVIAGCVGLVALVSAVVLLPSAGGGADAPSPARSSASPRPATAASSGAAGSATAAATKEAENAAISADDPVAAVQALLRARDRCVRALSVPCLDAVDQSGSSSRDDDSHLIRSLQQGGAGASDPSLAGATFVLTQRLGDSALLAAEPGPDPQAQGTVRSVLIMKGESGWRIRDFLP